MLSYTKISIIAIRMLFWAVSQLTPAYESLRIAQLELGRIIFLHVFHEMKRSYEKCSDANFQYIFTFT